MNDFKPRRQYAFTKLNDRGVSISHEIALNFERLTLFIETHVFDCNELRKCIDKLEEACYFAKRSVVTDRRNQIP